MARYIGSKCKLCRREGMKLFIKGLKCYTEKCPFTKRPFPPGQHGRAPRPKPSYYALQLREKQKVKRIYGILEKQFKRFFKIAERKKGETGKILIQLLERRLDNVIFRACFAVSRAQARQIVRHGFVLVNDKKVDIPSFLVREGDKITIKEKENIRNKIKENVKITTKERSVPGWLEVDFEKLEIKVIRLLEKEEVGLPIKEQLIVELYSK